MKTNREEDIKGAGMSRSRTRAHIETVTASAREAVTGRTQRGPEVVTASLDEEEDEAECGNRRLRPVTRTGDRGTGSQESAGERAS